ncbi:MAG: sodium:solute symporter family protein, partial [Clostridiales Family XIII bacterium]|nr:sodium:solute symporter family protein [Clostridiales Family XIII bacterium]
TARGALWGMIAGFVGYIVPKILGGAGVTAIFNGFLDPFFIGLYLSVIFTIIGSIGQIKSQEEVDMQKSLHIFPKREMDDKEFKRTYLYANGIMVIGVLFTVFLLLFWALPYNGII